MSQLRYKTLKSEPEFDLGFFLGMFGSRRIEHELLEKLETKWFEWLPKLKAYHFEPKDEANGKGVLLVHLGRTVDLDVDNLWSKTPADGFAMHTLAISMVMSAASGFIPELADGAGCAPVPHPTKELRKAIKKVGVTWNDQGALDHQYAVLTPYPYDGGCPICSLKDNCPKFLHNQQEG
ncbi:MAG: hypothetical protein ACNI3A_05720 [Desulfovibrio sp.]|uniref:hypothetical protein n=1 Tax=Desulfovibrio sp. 7SRBS1 TaxID=3378064 RepID=UPI003B3E1949